MHRFINKIKTINFATKFNYSNQLNLFRSINNYNNNNYNNNNNRSIIKNYNNLNNQNASSFCSKSQIEKLSLTFPFSIDLTVRGYEIDSLGHVNNSYYLSWFEHCRWEMWSYGLRPIFGDIYVVVRRAELDYLCEVKYGDVVKVSCWPIGASTTSFTLAGKIEIIKATINTSRIGRTAVTSQTVLTCLRNGSKVPIPAEMQQFFPKDNHKS
eukprot:TRINITY_DN6494_c1_g1_i1.p1 TRINITY_DN6494_c1_g1~~TRINITY_DN6494_c1_g1_i1.p1  ORF type:complete len:211 (+),score=76.91 TRINITY_DN6494_c1_g1_i1:90-722(+)